MNGEQGQLRIGASNQNREEDTDAYDADDYALTWPSRNQEDRTVKTIAGKLSQVHLRLLGLAAVLLIAAPPRAGAQQAIRSLRIERTGHTATRLPGGKVLVVGGENQSRSVRDSEVFDPASRTFSAATGLLTARADHTATILPDGRLFVIGGRASGKLLDSTEFYDPETGVFSAGPASTMRAPATPRPFFSTAGSR